MVVVEKIDSGAVLSAGSASNGAAATVASDESTPSMAKQGLEIRKVDGYSRKEAKTKDEKKNKNDFK